MAYTFTKYLSNSEAHRLGRFERTKFKRTHEQYNKSGLYLVVFEDGIKIGISKNVKDRLKVYRSPWCKKILDIVVYAIATPNRLEAKLKKHFSRSIKDGSSEFISGVKLESLMKFIEHDPAYKNE